MKRKMSSQSPGPASVRKKRSSWGCLGITVALYLSFNVSQGPRLKQENLWGGMQLSSFRVATTKCFFPTAQQFWVFSILTRLKVDTLITPSHWGVNFFLYHSFFSQVKKQIITCKGIPGRNNENSRIDCYRRTNANNNAFWFRILRQGGGFRAMVKRENRVRGWKGWVLTITTRQFDNLGNIKEIVWRDISIDARWRPG